MQFEFAARATLKDRFERSIVAGNRCDVVFNSELLNLFPLNILYIKNDPKSVSVCPLTARFITRVTP